MTPAQHQRIKALFDQAFELPSADQSHWLAQACPDDDAVRAAVSTLLRSQAEQPDFLETHSAAELLGVQASSLPQFAAGQQLGPFQLVRELGQGGGGTVWLAERADKTYDQLVAIKLVWPGFGSEAMLRFRQERKILAQLNHQNIARLLDGGSTSEGLHYLVMEYVQGRPFTTYCQEQQLSLQARLTLFRAICSAVQYAHQNLVIHRDLKPSNILVAPDGTPKLLDFGIAKLLERSAQDLTLTGTGLQPFTPLYASPEQIRNEPITTASDVYSLGVLLYELLTGVRPYGANATTTPEQMRAVCEDDPVRPSAVVAERMRGNGSKLKNMPAPLHPAPLPLPPSALRGDLDNIVLKAMRKEAALRYATVEQLSDDLQRYLDGQPVTARPATWRYRTGKYVGRNKPFVAAASTLSLALMIGALVTFWQLRASQAREHQQRYELYAADLRQASADWDEDNLVHMDELLERHRPGNGVDDEWRGFEWFALWKLLHTEKFNLQHQASTATVAFTPDGKALLTGTQERIEKWDAQTGQTLGRFATYPHGATGLSFFKTKTHLVVNNTRSRFGIWDYAAQQQILEVFLNHRILMAPSLRPFLLMKLNWLLAVMGVHFKFGILQQVSS